MNSSKYASPPTRFRTGHVHPRSLPAQAIRKTDSGFVVQFPSGAPITTPAVYRNAVYVSGGFRSKEFYALDTKTGRLKWGIGLDDDGPSSPACRDGVCVFGTESCTLFAVDADSGQMLWSHWLGDPLTSAPAIADGRVFSSYPARAQVHAAVQAPVPAHTNGKANSKATLNGKSAPEGASHALAAFDLKTGKILWQKWLDSDVMSAPLVTGGFVYATTFAGTILKLFETTGEIKYAINVRATSAPVVQRAGQGKQESMLFTRRTDPAAKTKPGAGDAVRDPSKPASSGGIKAAPAQSGTIKAGTEPGSTAEEEIVHTVENQPKTKYSAGKKKAIYLDEEVQTQSSYAAQGKANDGANGFSSGAPSSANPKASSKNIGQASVHTLQAFQGSRVLPVGPHHINTMGDEIVAIDAESGSKAWSFKLTGDLSREGGALGTAPLLAGSSVLVATLAGNVLRLEPGTGKVQNTYLVGNRVRSQPVAAEGWICVGTENGRLVGIDTKDVTIRGWPMWGGDAARTGLGMSTGQGS